MVRFCSVVLIIMRCRLDKSTGILHIGDFFEGKSPSSWDLRLYTGIRSVAIQEGCTRIPAGAFEGFSNLRDIDIPSTVKFVGSRAFFGCSSLRFVDLPDSIEFLGDNIFSYSGITSIDWPSQVDHVPVNTFYDCKRLVQFNCPHVLDTIGDGAFNGCLDLQLSTIKVKNYIGTTAFFCCLGLEQLNIEAPIVGQWAFKNCVNLRKVKVVNCKRLSNSCFGNCDLRDVTIVPPQKNIKSLFGWHDAFVQNDDLEIVKVHVPVDTSHDLFPFHPVDGTPDRDSPPPTRFVLECGKDKTKLTPYRFSLFLDLAKRTRNQFYVKTRDSQVNVLSIDDIKAFINSKNK